MAGVEVRRLAESLSDDLLQVENDALLSVEAVWLSGMGNAVSVATSTLKPGVRMALSGGKIVSKVSKVGDRSAAQAREHVEALLNEVATMSIAGIWRELLVCEQTMSEKYEGAAAAGRRVAEAARDEIVKQSLDLYDTGETGTLTRLAYDIDEQCRTSVVLQEPTDVLLLRLFTTERKRLSNLSGRGVWWRGLSGLQRNARGASIGCMNTLRVTAMTGMNKYLEAV